VLAIQHGAIETDRHGIVEIIRHFRTKEAAKTIIYTHSTPVELA
jgi:hypothetical protein